LSVGTIQRIDSSKIVRPEKLKIKRSINSLYYNEIVVEYDKAYVEDKYYRTLKRIDVNFFLNIEIISQH